MFNWSIEWIIGDGVSISFWFDSWNGAPLVNPIERAQRPPLPSCSLRDAAPLIHTLAPELEVRTTLIFSNCRDELKWRWERNGTYSSKSAYSMLIGGGKIKWSFARTWCYSIPPTVKIFVYHLLLGKILTHDVMIRRRMNVHPNCIMCNNCPGESALHLIFLCPYAVAVLIAVSRLMGQQIMVPGLSVQQIWYSSRRMYRTHHQQTISRKIWETRFVATCWFLWKQRNKVIFGGKLKPPEFLAKDIMLESELWIKYVK